MTSARLLRAGHLLAVDLGTGGPKVALVTDTGRVVDHDQERVRLLHTDDGGVEQDPDEWTDAIVTATNRLLARGTVPVEDVGAVCITAQWMGTVAVDEAGSPLGNALIWMDSRGAGASAEVAGGGVEVPGTGYNARRLRRWLSVTGGVPQRTGKDPVGHVRWLQHERPEVYAKAATFLDVPDFLTCWLTGRACAAYDTVVGLWCTDNRDLSAVAYDDELVARTGIDRAKLPELVPTGTVIGTVRPAVAERLGLGVRRDDVVVTTPTADTSSAGIGAGAVADFDAHLYVGTSSWLSCHVPTKHTDLRTSISALPSGIPGKYWVATEQDVAGKALQWAIDVLALGRDGDPFAELFALAAEAPAGSGGALFAPWLNGEQTPVGDHHLRGTWFNLGLSTGRAELCRAVLEGVALNTRWMLGATERFVRKDRPDGFPSLTFVGGGARSPLWCQIMADVLDRPIRQAADPLLANVKGAAFAGLVAMGALTWAEVPALVEISATYTPDPARRSVYDERYAAFRRLHRRTKGLFAGLNP